MRQISENLYQHVDTCNVYAIRTGDSAVLIDFGSGAILDRLDHIGVRRVTDILVTHHHRDQVQGLSRAAEAGIRIWVPPVEIDLIARADEHWRTRQLDNDYNLRDDRFTLLESVPVTGTVAEYRTKHYGGIEVFALPTPGHTIGSVSYLVRLDGRTYGFSGDLAYGPGQVWSLASTQWTYSGIEGLTATVQSCQALLDKEPDILLPSHGEPIADPPAGLGLLCERLTALATARRGLPWDPDSHRGDVWEVITPHLLRSRIAHAQTYALLSKDGTALFFDYGYDGSTVALTSGDRASRRPLLSSLPSLRRDHGVEKVEVAIPTHYHDDHVAGFNLLRDVEGTSIWSSANVAPVLASPRAYDLPCLWYDPIPTDRVLRLGEPVRWREYELTPYELPGHTLYAAAIAVEVDGRTVVVSGDQYDGGWVDGARGELLNYQYRNGFHPEDFVRSARLYRRLRPDLMVSGHWTMRWVDEDYLDMLLADGHRLAELHRQLLPQDQVWGRFGLGTRIMPYRSTARAGARSDYAVLVRNPLMQVEDVLVELVLPSGWKVDADLRSLRLGPGQEATVSYAVYPPAGTVVDRARIGVDLTVGSVHFGQVAEALVDVR